MHNKTFQVEVKVGSGSQSLIYVKAQGRKSAFKKAMQKAMKFFSIGRKQVYIGQVKPMYDGFAGVWE